MTLKTEPFYPNNLARSNRNAVKKSRRARPRFLPFPFTPRGGRPSPLAHGVLFNHFCPQGLVFAFGESRIKGGVAAPGLEPKHEKGLGFHLKTQVLSIKNQSATRVTPCGRAPSFGFFPGGKVNLPPVSGEKPWGRLAEEVHSPER